jgi:hypothetical protein
VAKKNAETVQRRKVVEQMRREQAAKERRRTLVILGVCIVIVVGLLAVTVIPYVKHQRALGRLDREAVSRIGADAKAAGCSPVKETVTDHNQNHIPAPQTVTYKEAPPAFGPHRPEPAPFQRKFYSGADRPEVAQLVHNLEHGYNIVWYDDTVAADKKQLDELRTIARKYQDQKFIVAPWKGTDGAAFPSGKHLALTHWYADPSAPTNQDKQRGVWEYCRTTSGAVISDFTKKYPYSDAPEPNAM